MTLPRLPFAIAGLAAVLGAQDPEPYRGAPVHYEQTGARDPVAALARRLDAGDLELSRSERFGLLPGLLDALDVPDSSQTLVFSKTSFQNDRIGPTSPRALFFGDRAYVGYVPGSSILELTAVDPDQGAVFYTVTDEGDGTPRIQRDDAACLQCHAFSWTNGWPGHLVRSVFPGLDGLPIQRFGADVVDHDTAFAERWGGYYVTGAPADMKHRGNRTWRTDANAPEDADGTEPLDPSRAFDAARYPQRGSDVVALMVLEHQTRAQNLLGWAGYQAKLTLDRQAGMNRSLGEPADHRSETTRNRIHELADEILRVLLFRDEPPLPAPITAHSTFAADFADRGPRDSVGRSLRTFDLRTRLFRWPCSYVIQSDAFAALHPEIREVVLLRMHRILTGRFGRRAYRHLSADDRETILAIVRDTVDDLPASWHETGGDR